MQGSQIAVARRAGIDVGEPLAIELHGKMIEPREVGRLVNRG